MTKRQWINITILIVLLASYFIYNNYSENYFNKYGVYTVAKITNWEAAEQGSYLYLEIYFGGKIYQVRTSDQDNKKVGKYYFIRVSSNDPTLFQGLLNEIPDCILKKGIPKDGWKQIPKCD